MKIERTLFWFNDGNESLQHLNEYYFPYGTLLNRLMNQQYEGKKIKFINIHLATELTYTLHPELPKNNVYYYGGHLTYYDLLDLDEFKALQEDAQKRLAWEKCFKSLQNASRTLKNASLAKASEYAYQQGLKMALNPNYKMLEADVILHDQPVKAALWLHFRNNNMYSVLTLEKDDLMIFRKEIDGTKMGVEFFMEMYKEISAENNTIVIVGSKDVDYLPLRIPINKAVLEK